MSKPQMLIAGDQGVEQYVYIASLPDQPANLRDAWVNAKEFWAVQVPGGAGQLASYLGTNRCRCIPSVPSEPGHQRPESVYILTKKAARSDEEPRWKVELAIVAGERPFPCSKHAVDDFDPGAPVVILDFYQGWVERNLDLLPSLLSQRRYLVRTHDPTGAVGKREPQWGEVWREVRRQSAQPGIWFSPHQDMADGALRVTGNWETLRSYIISYLKNDETLWDQRSQVWRHYVVVQISYDGALIVGPGGNDTVVVFPGDQVDSFTRREKGQVIGGGIMIVASLADLLHREKLEHRDVVAQAAMGLARARELLRLGYAEDARQTRVIYPKPALDAVSPGTHDYPVEYHPPEDSIQNALAIIQSSGQEYRKRIVYSAGKLSVCDPTFAEQLLCLRERVEGHARKAEGKGVLSFAIFGGPGSGKSFVVEQVMDEVQGSLQHDLKNGLEKRIYNVSQFGDPDQLKDALIEVQARSLQGKIPFVLWDEFDCPYDRARGGWLSKFLMPMQDAEFWDGEGRRALSKCVFAFIGGTWQHQREFSEWTESARGLLLKGRDFHSRLDRILEVPDVEVQAPDERPKPPGYPILNRALAIRLMLNELAQKGLGDVSHIDQNVAEFLLQARLRHGMRSLKTIIEASSLKRTARFCARHLPPREVLIVHVADIRDWEEVLDRGFTDPVRIGC